MGEVLLSQPQLRSETTPYTVAPIPALEAKAFIAQHHYARGSHNGPSPRYGLFEESDLIGVCLFATPCSENVRRSVFGLGFESRVTELHRLAVIDETPKNTESWFVSRCLKLLKQDKPHIWAVVSFADETEGHRGVIYQALNFIYYGRSSPTIFYLDQDNRLRHPRQNGKNITRKEALTRGWSATRREGKYRYLAFLPDNRGHLKYLKNLCRVIPQGYPKASKNGE